MAIGLGLSGLQPRDRVRYGLAFAVAEGGMPLVGFSVGSAVAGLAGEVASYLAVVLLIAVGLYTIYESLNDDGESDVDTGGALRLITTALAVGLDELAVGFSLGLLGLPILLTAVLIALQAFLLTLIGVSIGRRVGKALAERAEMLSGVVLALLGIALLIEKLTRMPSM